MKNHVFWSVFIVLLILIAFLFYRNFCSNDKVRVIETENVSSQISERRMCDLEEKVVRLEERVRNLERTDPQTTTRAVTRTSRPVSTPASASSPKPAARPVTQANIADLSHLQDINGDIIFCVMANNDGGMHFPQFALEKGVEFRGIQSNTTSDGNNWLVNPLPSIDGDYGVTYDGTFFVSHQVIENIMSERLDRLAIKSSFTKWQAHDMILKGNYWVYKTR